MISKYFGRYPRQLNLTSSSMTFKQIMDKIDSNQIKSMENKTVNLPISMCIGLNRFMRNVFLSSGLSIFGALSISKMLIDLPILATATTSLTLGGSLALILGLMGSWYIKPQY